MSQTFKGFKQIIDDQTEGYNYEDGYVYFVRKSTSDDNGHLVLNGKKYGRTQETSTAYIIDKIYPVGSIYITTNEISPKTLFGVGEWEQIKDRFLLSAGDTYQGGSTGGEATVKLTSDQIPSHTHFHVISDKENGIDITEATGVKLDSTEVTTKGWEDSSIIRNTGGGKSHNNMPPYLTVYMWKRIN